LRRVCSDRQLTAAALAKRIGRSEHTVERMLAGESDPGLALIDDIARKLDVPIAELMRGL
jgi:transcriptional regulator with XRE-family HTH domain